MTIQRWRITLWLATVAAIVYVMALAGGALMPVAVGALLAYTLAPLVDRVASVIPLHSPKHATVRRGLAVALVYLGFGAIILLVLLTLLPILADQVSKFIATLPAYFVTAHEQVDLLLREYRDRLSPETRQQVETAAGDIVSALAGALTGAARQSVSVVTGTLSVIFGYAAVPFLMFYMMRDRDGVLRGIIAAVPPPLRHDAANVLAMADSVLGRYIRGQLLLGLIVGTAVGVSLTLLGVPLSLGLGVWAGVTELIPIIGPWIGAIPGLLLVSGAAPEQIIAVALVYLVVQQLENNFLVPRIQGQATDLHPGMVLLLMVLAGAAFGFAGLIVALPATAILREMFWYADRRLGGAAPVEAFKPSRAWLNRHANADSAAIIEERD